jgi:hypothetical protein
MIRHSQSRLYLQTTKFNLCNIAKLKQGYTVAKKGGGRELTIKTLTIQFPSKLPGRDQLVYNRNTNLNL